MTLTLTLPAPLEHRLAIYAKRIGKPVEALAVELLDQATQAERTFDEILAPFRQSFAESGMTEEELDALVEEARNEIWQEKHGGRG